MAIADWYFKNLSKLMIIPIIMFIVSIAIVGNTIHRTGDFVLKDVSLTGGTTARVESTMDITKVEDALESELGKDVTVKKLTQFGSSQQIGFTIEVEDTPAADIERILTEKLGLTLTDQNFSIEQTGSSLGESFYQQMLRAIIFAFILMAIVIVITFRTFIPSIAIIGAAFFDIIVAIAAIDILGIKVSTAGVAAILLLIGYSIDTDVLLTTRVLRHEGPTEKKILSSIKTGTTMTFAALAALLVGIIVSNSDVIREMFLIILFGLTADFISTWIMNVWIIRWYVERKK